MKKERQRREEDKNGGNGTKRGEGMTSKKTERKWEDIIREGRNK